MGASERKRKYTFLSLINSLGSNYSASRLSQLSCTTAITTIGKTNNLEEKGKSDLITKMN